MFEDKELQLIAKILTLYAGQQFPVKYISEKLNVPIAICWYYIVQYYAFKPESKTTKTITLQSKINCKEIILIKKAA